MDCIPALLIVYVVQSNGHKQDAGGSYIRAAVLTVVFGLDQKRETKLKHTVTLCCTVFLGAEIIMR